MPDPEPFAGLQPDEPPIDAESWPKAGRRWPAGGS